MAVKIRAFQKNRKGVEVEFAILVKFTGELVVAPAADFESSEIESRELAEMLLFHKWRRMRAGLRSQWNRLMFKQSNYRTFKNLWARVKKNTRFEIEEV